MGHLHARGDFCHLYVNGHYWGLYNTCERPKAAFGARYFGGNVENFDVIKIVGRKPNTFGRSQNAYTIFASDGNLKAWHALWEGSYGQDLTTEKYLSLSQPQAESRETDILLDPVNLIDYMLIILYGGNRDSPVSGFMGNSRPNNWWGLRDRTANRGFQFLIWDAEHTLLKVDEDRLGPFDAGRTFDRSNPQWIWQQCLKNEEFRMLLSDRVYKHFFHGGALTPEACQERLSKRAKEIELAVIAESARWGDSPASRGRRQWSQSQPEAMNRDDHWLVELDRILNDYMPTRSRIVFQQLMIDTSGLSDGLLTKVQFVQVTPRGGSLKPDESISLSAPEGQVYYTLDGSDPRAVGGQISDAAQRSTGNLRLTKDATLKARAYHEGEWSALEDLTFQITPSP